MRNVRTTILVFAMVLVQLAAIMIALTDLPVAAGPGQEGRGDPVLSNGGVTPTSGDPKNDTFVFYVTYYDADGDWPTNITVTIDGSYHGMDNGTWSGKSGNFTYSSYDFESGTHDFYFQCYNYYFNKTARYPSTGTLTFTVDPGYHRPVLMNWSISNSEPMVGETVNFSVWYKDQDGDPILDSYLYFHHFGSFQMTSTGSDFKNGVLLKRNWTVSSRNTYGYAFFAFDTTRLQAVTPLMKFTVPDHPPELFNPCLAPKTGDARNVSFTFSIWMKDIDGECYWPYVVIDDGYRNVTWSLSNYSYSWEEIRTGINFSDTIDLYSGEHNYYFYTDVWEYSNGSERYVGVRYPKTGYLTMTAGGNYNPPVLYNGSVAPKQGNLSTEFTFRVWYKDVNGDPPSFVSIEKDRMELQNGNGSMTIKGTDYKNGVLCELKSKVKNGGNHYIYFYSYDKTGLRAYSQTNQTEIAVMGTPGLTSLSNGHVSPRVTEKDREVQFFVDYTDETRGFPYEHTVVVNGELFYVHDGYWTENDTIRFYNWWSPQYLNSSGRTGRFSYHFEFIDSQLYPLRYPETGELSFDVFDHIPYLFGPSVTPKEGDDLTEFEFGINYTDWQGITPSSVQILMDGTSYNMEVGPKIDMGYGNYSNQTYRVCKKKLVLSPGEHEYYFKANIPGGAYNIYPTEGELRLTVDGHSSLYGADVSPEVAYTDSELNFTVTFKDTSGLKADYVQVFIDNDVHEMARVGGNTLTGTQYSFETRLTKGNHTYYFVAENDHGWLREPEKGKYHTLTVLEPHAPSLLNALVSPATGNISTEFTFSCTYMDLDGDTPDDGVVLTIDGSPHDMNGPNGSDLRTGVKYTYSTKLTKGIHSYFFETEDATGRMGRLPAKDTFTITVTDDGGSSPGKKKAPLANIILTYSGNKVTFNGKGSTDPDGNITFYSWVIDGQMYSGGQVTVEFEDIGYYKATLTVVDNDGLSDTTSTGFWVFAGDAPPSSSMNDVGASVHIDKDGNGNVLVNESGFEVNVNGTDDGKVSLHVKSHDAEPKVVIFEVSKELLKVSEDGTIVLEVDGVEVEMADSLEEVLTANGSKPFYYLIDTGDSFKVVLYLPDPSDVDVDISAIEPERSSDVDGSTILIVFLIIVVLVLIVAMAISYLRFRGIQEHTGGVKRLNNARRDDSEGSIVSTYSPWKVGLGSDLDPYMDEVLEEGSERPMRHNMDSLGARLRKRKEKGDLTESEFRKYSSILERIREE